MRSVLLLLIFTTTANIFQAQQVWNLKMCVEHAMKNNLQIKQSAYNKEISKKSLEQSYANTLPTINGFATHTYNFGQTIDPFTNQFASQQVRSNSLGLNGQLVLFGGLQNVHSIQQNKLAYTASEYDLQKTKNDIAIAVSSAYLQVIFAEEQFTNVSNQAALTLQQRNRIEKLYNVGSVAKSALLDIEAQLALEELQVVNSENQVNMSYLNLKQLLELDANANMQLEKPEIASMEAYMPPQTANGIYETSLENMPEIKSAEYKYVSSKKKLAAAKGSISPRLTLSGNYGSGYSGLQKEITGVSVTGIDTIGFTGSGDFVYQPTYTFETQSKSFNDQLRDNVNRSVGFTLTIPIFNGWTAKTNIGVAKLNMQGNELALEQTKRQLQKNVQTAHADVLAAFQKYRASNKSFNAFKESFTYAQSRFEQGVSNSIEFNDTKNKLIKAESELLQAKYDLLFKIKILDFYQGKPIEF
jgi:outer membrane protein